MSTRSITRKILIVLVAAAMLLLVLASTQPVSAGSQDATFEKIEIEVTPSIQGVGGTMEVKVIAYFFGGCCYQLFAEDITCSLEVPVGLTDKFNGSTPAKVDSLTALAGGEATLTFFTFTLRCDEVGSYMLNATVDSSNCGSRMAEAEVHVIKGATITKPEYFPPTPTTESTTMIDFDSMYPVGDIEVTQAQVYYFASDKKYETAEMVAVNETLEINGNPMDFDGVLECDRDEVTGTGFKTELPQTDKPYMYYWIVVKDENDKATTSQVYRIDVEDTSAVQMLNMISFIFLVVTLIILVFILYISHNVMAKKRLGDEEKDSFSVLGPIGRKRFLTRDETEKFQIRQESIIPVIVIGIIILILIIVTVVLAITGSADELFTHILDGK